MAASRDTTAANIKPLQDALFRRVQLGATVAAGELISLQSDGKWDPAIATSVVKSCRVAVQGGADTEYVDAVSHGAILCLSGATIGAWIYVSDTAGEPSETAGTKDFKVGDAESATILFVDPQVVDFS